MKLQNAPVDSQAGKAEDDCLPRSRHVRRVDSRIKIVMVIVQVHSGGLGEIRIRLFPVSDLTCQDSEDAR